ncbi:TlpA family protein disulfide reductase [Anatilimnocola floriformis]|uniref:TlpA family protein disulfide reductase n=1 Tax=Anatilimnocola floriformis TaxID=2948575 RepID=UPI0020C372EB|nr:TlpA disulfide reductase family protein [Anatilimnocola floriformis]
MFRSWMLFALLVALASPAWSAEEKIDAAAVKADAGNAETWNKYASAEFSRINELLDDNIPAAESALAEFEKVVLSIEPTSDDAKEIVTRIKNSVPFFKKRIEIAKLSLADLEKDLATKPDGESVVSKYLSKVQGAIAELSDDVAKAEAKLADAKDRLAKAREIATDEAVMKEIDGSARVFTSLERMIATTKKLDAMVGKDAAPLAVEAWVNGAPLTDGDLKGKVVLLDFWAVWCGPCIATFPHLREWQAEYGDKGLVIVGLTNYYKFKWNEEAKKAQGSKEEVSHEDEQAMLVKFAESHNLKHRFAIQDGKSMAEYYGVNGIPHVVLIDQQGKIQLARVGSGPKNAHAIEAALKKLLDAKPTSK